MKWTETLLAGVGQHLADTTEATWRVAGDYAADDTWPVFMIGVPGAPDRILVLSPYGVDATLGSDVTQGLQVRFRGPRGDPRPVDAMRDEVFDALHGLGGVTLNSVPVVLVTWQSDTYLGVDSNGRFEATANYYVQAARPGTHRTD